MRTRRSANSTSMSSAASSAASSALNAILSVTDLDSRVSSSSSQSSTASSPVPSLFSRASRRSHDNGADDTAIYPFQSSSSAPIPSSENGTCGTMKSALPNLAILCVFGAAAALALAAALRAGIAAAGLAGPAWATFKALERRPGSASLESWARFWILAGLLFALDRIFLGAFLGAWLPDPVYPALLFSAVVWLSNDNAKNSNRIYGTAVQPLFLNYERNIDSVAEAAADKVSEFSRYGLMQVSNVLRPIAMQLDHAAMRAQEKHDRLLQSKNDRPTIMLNSDDDYPTVSRLD